MLLVALLTPRLVPFLFLLGGVILLYTASLVGVRALAADDSRSPGRRAVGHWLPILGVAVAATVLRRADLAVGVIFATSVICLSLMLGILTLFSPLDEHPAERRGWPFVLPAALLALLAGFGRGLTLLHAGVLAMLGLAVWSVWTERRHGEATDPFQTGRHAVSPARRPAAGPLLVLALLLVVAGGAVAATGVARASATIALLPAGLLAATVVGPLVAMPMLATSSALAERGQGASMASTLVAVVLLNLCVALPTTILIWHVQPGVARAFGLGTGDVAATQPASRPTVDERYSTARAPLLGLFDPDAEPMPYPLTVWRIDTVLVLVLGFALVPVSLGRWSLGRTEAVGLILGYAVYLLLRMYFPRVK